MPVAANERPLGVRADLSLSTEQIEMMRSLEAYAPWFVEERLARSGVVAPERIPGTVLEFKRYMALVGLGYRRLAMLNPEVDEVWHTFILFTREYAEFCQAAFGTFIHHVPRTSRSAIPEASGPSFLDAYAEVFGEVPAVWYGEGAAGRAGSSDEPSGCGTEDCTDG